MNTLLCNACFKYHYALNLSLIIICIEQYIEDGSLSTTIRQVADKNVGRIITVL